MFRAGLPPGGSIWTTSAPRSARIFPASRPRSSVRSRTRYGASRKLIPSGTPDWAPRMVTPRSMDVQADITQACSIPQIASPGLLRRPTAFTGVTSRLVQRFGALYRKCWGCRMGLRGFPRFILAIGKQCPLGPTGTAIIRRPAPVLSAMKSGPCSQSRARLAGMPNAPATAARSTSAATENSKL